MNRRLIFAGLTLAGVTASFWWFARPAPAAVAVAPVAAPPFAPDAAVVIALSPPSAPGAPPLPTDIAVVEPAMPDAGEAIEVTLEVFDEKGHVAGGTIVLKNPPCGAAGERTGGVEVEARTNVMGFARIALVPGSWEVENFRSTPARIEVGSGQTAFVLHRADWVPTVIEGTVVDDASAPIEAAEVRARAEPRKPGPHGPPEGESVAFSDAQGRFALKTYAPGLTVQARKDTRASAPVAAIPGGKPVVLRLFTPAWVDLRASCDPLFVQYEYGADVIELSTRRGAEVAVAAGHRRFRARCLQRGALMGGFQEVDLAPEQHLALPFALSRLRGLEVRVVSPLGQATPGVTVIAADPPAVARGGGPDGGIVTPRALAVSDKDGRLELVPDQLTAFDPLYRLGFLGPWRTQGDVLARLGDQPVTLVAVPR